MAKDLPEKVDLATHDPALDELILTEYPPKLFPDEQRHVDDIRDTGVTALDKTYRYFDLDYQSITKFLEGRNFEYELVDSKTGRSVKVSQKVPQQTTN